MKDQKPQLLMGIAWFLAAAFMLLSAFFTYQAEIAETAAENLRDSAFGVAGLTFGLILRLGFAIFAVFLGFRMLKQKPESN